jgi:hypothetical protein
LNRRSRESDADLGRVVLKAPDRAPAVPHGRGFFRTAASFVSDVPTCFHGTKFLLNHLALAPLKTNRSYSMARDEHNKAAEHHENAAKSHRAAAERHGKNDHAKGKEHSASAQQHSQNARQHSEQAHSKSQQQK